MLAYIARRLLLIIPSIFGIMLASFVIVQYAPGGPIERIRAQLQGLDKGGRLGGGSSDLGAAANVNAAAGDAAGRGATVPGLDPRIVAELEKKFGLDKPAYVQFWIMVRNYALFDFGKSYLHSKTVMQLIKDKLPVSITLGLWMTLLSYLISIPLGIRKAVSDGSKFDVWTSAVVIIGYAIPSFLFAVLLIVLFAGGSFWQVFPLRGLTSDNFDEMTTLQQIGDYLWHITLPVAAMVLSVFATTSFLTKNSFLDEIRKQYVQTARMKGLTERQVLYGHVFRNAMMIVVSGFPGAFISAFFTGAILIEQIFSLDGLGNLSYKSIIDRDYPVVFANLYVFSLIGLFVNLLSDLIYTWIDPRVDFETREV